ncbi:MAG TPA: hypothetical protein DIC64_02290 [Alphaproteobacteria bacterium]|nr:hypothetical protein [Alphaproteobacteria bacterium]
MIALYNKLLAFWFSFPQSVRFLLVGGFDTVVAFCSYSLLIYIGLHYSLTLIVNYIFSVSVSIFNMRYFVYKSQNTFIKEYSKGWMTYLSTLCINYVFLFFAIDVFHVGAIKAQAVYTVLITIYIYFMHKYFTFSNRKLQK